MSSRLPRLLLFVHSLEAGGAERVAADLANYWVKGGAWEVTMVTVSSEAKDFYQLNPKIERVSLGLAIQSPGLVAALHNNFRRIRALRRVLLRVRPNIALAFMTTSNIVLGLAALHVANVIAIGSEHIHPPCMPLAASWRLLRRYGYGQLRAIAALTHESQSWLLQNTNAPRVDVIPNAVAWPLMPQPPSLLPADFVESSRNVLLAVGRLEEQKGFDLLIQAFQSLAYDQPKWDLVILGDGSLRERLLEQIGNARLGHRIKMPGRAGNIGAWYERADLYVMSSRYEGFGNTLAEAMAYGVPVVSFDCDAGPRDIVRHGTDGLLVPAGNVRALTESLRQLMTRADLRRQYGLRAMEIRECLGMKKVAGLWEALFEDLSK